MNDGKIVEAKIGSMQFFVDNITENNHNEKENTSLGIRKTGATFSEITSNASKNLTDVLSRLSKELQQHWEHSTASVSSPNEMSVEVSFAFEGSVNAWVIVGKGSTGVKATFKWIRTTDESKKAD